MIRRCVTACVALSATALSAAGCAAASPARLPGDLFGALARRDLVGLEQRIALASRQRHDADAIAVARGWADLVVCRPLSSDEPSAAWARLIHATLRLEQSRHARLLAEAQLDVLARTWLAHLHEPAYFSRTAPDEVPAGSIRWLADSEVWIDELPIARSVVTACLPIGELAAPVSGDEAARTVDDALTRELEHADRVMQRAREALDEGGSEDDTVRSIGWRAAWHALATDHQRALRAPDDDAPARWLAVRARSEELMMLTVPPSIAPQMLARARLLGASLRERDGDLEGALALTLQAMNVLPSMEADVAMVARYRALALARRLERWEVARPLMRPLPAPSDPMAGPIAFEAVRAASAIGAVDEVLELATSALRDQALHGRFLPAVLQTALSEIAALEFDARVVELVEDLGPRHETRERMAQLAAIALEGDRPAVARGAAEWLRAHDSDARNHARYLGWLALAAFLERDRDAFSAHVRALTERPAALRRAIGRSREPAFFAQQDRALSTLLGELLTRVAEWDESRAAERARWLELVVGEIQSFLQRTSGTGERDALLALYRAASAELRETPRGYPEHIGGSSGSTPSRAPLVVGRVRIDAVEPAPLELGPLPSGVASFAILPGETGWTDASVAFPVTEEATR